MTLTAGAASIAFSALLCLNFSDSAFASVAVYPNIPALALSSVYTVSVNGQNVPVNFYNGNSFAWFSFSGTVNVVVTVNQNVTSYQLSPMSYNIPSSASGSNISFSLNQPRKLDLRKVNGLTEELFIFADAPESNPPTLGSSGVFNIQTYGASSANANSTPAIQQAIDAASANSGGGVAFVPAGNYSITGSVLLKSNVNLYLAPGAVINIQPGSYAGVPFPITNTTGASITGRGAIYAQNSSVNTPQIQTFNNTNLNFVDILMVAAPSTLLRFGYEVNSGAHNVKVLAGGPGLADGIDTDSVFNFTIENSFIWSTDDNTTAGSGTDVLAYTTPGNTDGLIIRNNVMRETVTGHVFSMVPTLPWQFIRNILVENNDSITVQTGIGMYPSDGQVQMSGITIRNNRFEEIRSDLVEAQSLDFFAWGGCHNGFYNHDSGSIANVLFDNNILGNAPPTTSNIFGRSASQNISNFQINNLIINGSPATTAVAANISPGLYVTNFSITTSPSPLAMLAALPTPTNTPLPAIDSSCGGTAGAPLSDPSYTLQPPFPGSTAPLPTPTPLPPPTSSPPLLTVLKAAGPITIDGSLSDWTGAQSVTFGPNNSATVYALWDANNLYLAFKVSDTQLNAIPTVRDDSNIWNNDAFELFLDTLNNGGTAMQTDDYHFIVDVNNSLWDSRGTGSGEDVTFNAPVQSAVVMHGTLNNNADTDTDRIVEMAIPFSSMGVTPSSGAIMGIDFSVSDKSALGFTYYDYAGISANPSAVYAQPNLWSKLKLDGTLSSSLTALSPAKPLGLSLH